MKEFEAKPIDCETVKTNDIHAQIDLGNNQTRCALTDVSSSIAETRLPNEAANRAAEVYENASVRVMSEMQLPMAKPIKAPRVPRLRTESFLAVVSLLIPRAKITRKIREAASREMPASMSCGLKLAQRLRQRARVAFWYSR